MAGKALAERPQRPDGEALAAEDEEARIWKAFGPQQL